MSNIVLDLTDREADMLVRVIRATPAKVFSELIRETLPDPYLVGMRLQILRDPEAYGLISASHDWVEVTSHGSPANERHLICAHCSEFKIERTSQC